MTKGFIWTFEIEGTISPLVHLKKVQEETFCLIKNQNISGTTVSLLRS